MRRRPLLMACLLAPGAAAAQPRAIAWERWRAHAPGSRHRLDHAAFDGVLARHRRMGADGVARFDYAAARGARAPLDAYLAMLQAQDIAALDRPEQFAFWANLYNALTLAVVLDHWPVASIRDIAISPGLFARGPWGARLARLAGEALTLDDIEHRILRPLWRDARVHYAVNCASIGCPNLPARAFRGDGLDGMLDAAARDFVNHPRGAGFDAGGRLVVSSLYRWFREDFGGDDAGVLAHLVRYATPDHARRIAARGRLDDHAYDWAINAA